jgi:hypothetical protein
MGHSTIWKEAKIDDTSNALSFYLPRTVTCLDELQKMELNSEVDLVTYILGKYIIFFFYNNYYNLSNFSYIN